VRSGDTTVENIFIYSRGEGEAEDKARGLRLEAEGEMENYQWGISNVKGGNRGEGRLRSRLRLRGCGKE
jgi:hypothetical protein